MINTKYYFKRAGFGLLFLLLFQTVSSQNYHDAASTNFRLWRTHYSYNKNADADININETKFSLPLNSEKKYRGYIGGTYHHFSLSTVALSNIQYNRLTSLRFDVGAIYDITEQNSLFILLTPGLHSDLDDLSTEDFQVGTKIFFKKQHDEKTHLYYGLEYRRAAFGNSILPILGIEKQISDRLFYKIHLPYEATFRYTIKEKKFYAGLKADYHQNSYRLTDFSEQDYIRTDQIFGFAFLEYMLFTNVAAWAKAGLPIYTEFGVYKKDDLYTDVLFLEKPDKKIAEPYHQDFAKGITFEVGLAYRLWFDDKDL